MTLHISPRLLILHCLIYNLASSLLTPDISTRSNTALPSTDFNSVTTETDYATTIPTTPSSRRSFFQSSSTFLTILATTTIPTTALAADEKRTMQEPLYYILRVREATVQESRIIKSGKFKDAQRGNIKLAVKFMLENYRLNDNFIAASAFLKGDKRINAINAGQNTVQNLYTILEYFDSSDVQNLKVSNSLGQKEIIVLNGLDATRKGIDEFISFFPADEVGTVVTRINDENDLNLKEYDTGLGQLVNPTPMVQPSVTTTQVVQPSVATPVVEPALTTPVVVEPSLTTPIAPPPSVFQPTPMEPPPSVFRPSN